MEGTYRWVSEGQLQDYESSGWTVRGRLSRFPWDSYLMFRQEEDGVTGAEAAIRSYLRAALLRLTGKSYEAAVEWHGDELTISAGGKSFTIPKKLYPTLSETTEAAAYKLAALLTYSSRSGPVSVSPGDTPPDPLPPQS